MELIIKGIKFEQVHLEYLFVTFILGVVLGLIL